MIFQRICLFLAITIICVVPVAADDGNYQEPDLKCFNWIAKHDPYFNAPSHFDITQDGAIEGESYACTLGVNAEQVHNALSAFKDALIFPSKLTIEKAIRFPFIVSMKKSDTADREKWEIKDWHSWKKFRDQYVQPSQVALIMCSSIKNLKMIPDKGVMIGNGLVWLNGLPEFKAGTMNLMEISDDMVLKICKSSS